MNYIELAGIIVGIAIISIETYVIFLLNKHTNELENHTHFLEKSLTKHIENLNEHVKIIEKKIEFLCNCMNNIDGTNHKR